MGACCHVSKGRGDVVGFEVMQYTNGEISHVFSSSFKGCAIDGNGRVRIGELLEPAAQGPVNSVGINALQEPSDGGFTGGPKPFRFPIIAAPQPLEHRVGASLSGPIQPWP